MTNSTTRDEFAIPPLPAPYTVASTIKCIACGAPYEPARALAPHAAGNPFGQAMSSGICKCGSSTFGGTASYDMPSPAQFTANQMNARYVEGYLAARRAALLEAAKVCEDERLKYLKKAGDNDGRESDFAFGSVRSLEFIAEHLRALADEGMKP